MNQTKLSSLPDSKLVYIDLKLKKGFVNCNWLNTTNEILLNVKKLK